MATVVITARKYWRHYCYHCFTKAADGVDLSEWLLGHAVFYCPRNTGPPDEREEAAQLVATWYPALQVVIV